MITKAQIAETLNTVLEINESSSPAVSFFEFSGHINLVRVRVYPKGRVSGENPIAYEAYEDIHLFEKIVFSKSSKRESFQTFEEWIDSIREEAS